MSAHPLELVLRVNGNADLLDANGDTVWASDGDSDFWEFIETDFLEDDDIEELLGYLADADIITQDELEAFESDEFAINIEEPDGEESDVIEGEIVADDED